MVSYQKGKTLLKPYEKRFFSKVNYTPINFKTWFPKMDTDRDGVPDYKDCQPFNPKKQDDTPVEDELQYQETIYIYLFNPDTKQWDYQGDFFVDESIKTMLSELEEMYGKDSIYVSDTYINPRKIGKQDTFKEFKQKFGEYVEGRQWKQHLKEGVQPRKETLKAYHKQAKPHIEGPRITKDILEREREIAWGRKDRYPWVKYSPINWQQVSVKAPWQEGIRWNANFQRTSFRPPVRRRYG